MANNTTASALYINLEAADFTVGTHNGVFHADDVFCVAFLNMLREAYDLAPCKVVRSRVLEDWNNCNVLVDVGEGPLDHHGAAMQHCGDKWEKYPTVPASAFKLLLDELQPMCPWGVHLFDDLALQIAAQDNGVRDVEVPHVVDLEWVHMLNPTWVEHATPVDFDRQFEAAVAMAQQYLSMLERKRIAEEAAEEQYMLMKEGPDENFAFEIPAGLPDWQKVVCDFWDADYVFFEGVEGTWYIQCVPENAEDIFSKRKPLPEAWAGKRGVDLGEVIAKTEGIYDFAPEDAVFCHIGRFLMGVKTRDAAIKVLEALHYPTVKGKGLV